MFKALLHSVVTFVLSMLSPTTTASTPFFHFLSQEHQSGDGQCLLAGVNLYHTFLHMLFAQFFLSKNTEAPQSSLGAVSAAIRFMVLLASFESWQPDISSSAYFSHC